MALNVWRRHLRLKSERFNFAAYHYETKQLQEYFKVWQERRVIAKHARETSLAEVFVSRRQMRLVQKAFGLWKDRKLKLENIRTSLTSVTRASCLHYLLLFFSKWKAALDQSRKRSAVAILFFQRHLERYPFILVNEVRLLLHLDNFVDFVSGSGKKHTNMKFGGCKISAGFVLLPGRIYFIEFLINGPKSP